MTKHEKSLIALLILIATLGVFYFRGLYIESKRFEEVRKENLRYEHAFGSLNLEAKAAYVFDVAENKAIYFLNEEQTLPLASLTKIMTALVALDVIPPKTIVSIPREALLQEGDNGLFSGESWILSDLMKFMLVVSSNDAAKAISLETEKILPVSASAQFAGKSRFIQKMNEKAASLNLNKMSFTNETGLDAPDMKTSGGYGTAREVAELFLNAYQKYPDVFKATSAKTSTFISLSGFSHTVKNTDAIIEAIPSVIASKTGNTDLAGGNLVIIFNIGTTRPIVASVLGSTVDGRFSDMEQLIKASIKYITEE